MPEDIEIGVRLVPDTTELEDVEDRQIGVAPSEVGTGGGGDPGGEAATGGFAGAELGELLGPGAVLVGLLAGILSQIKIVTQFVGLIFRLLGRALLPAIQLLVVALRPLLTSLARGTAGLQTALDQPGRTARLAGQRFQRDTNAGNIAGGLVAGAVGAPFGVSPQQGFNFGEGFGGPSVDAIASVLNSNPSTSDTTDERRKNQQANIVKDVLELLP